MQAACLQSGASQKDLLFSIQVVLKIQIQGNLATLDVLRYSSTVVHEILGTNVAFGCCCFQTTCLPGNGRHQWEKH